MATLEQLQDLLKKAQKEIAERDNYIATLGIAPATLGIIVDEVGEQFVVSALGAQALGLVPKVKKMGRGDLVMLAVDGSISAKAPDGVQVPGTPGSVTAIHGRTVEVQTSTGGTLVVSRPPSMPLDVGSRVLMVGPLLREVLPDPPAVEAKDAMAVAWDDVKGQPEAVAALQELASDVADLALFRAYNRQLPKGVLLWGPPGNGKTLLAKALATALKAKGGDGSGFYAIKGAEILSKWVGESEATIRALFTQARRFKRDAGRPAVIFIDEADALLRGRGSYSASGMEATLVPQFLSEMDGIEESGAIVVLATNRPRDLDEAVVREGRVDLKIEVRQPARAIQPEFFTHYLSKRPVAAPAEALAQHAVDCCWETPVQGRRGVFMLGSALSGARIATMVELSATSAFRRDHAEKRKKPSGVCGADLVSAIDTIRTGLEATHA